MHASRSIFGSSAELDAFRRAVAMTVDPATGDEKYRDDFTAWCREVAGKDPEQYQSAIAQSVIDNRTTLVPSCNGAGKSYIAALIIVWWVLTHPDPFVVWTAPKFRQVKKTMGRYIAAVIGDLTKRGIDHGLTLTKSQELYLHGVDVGQGVSPADNDEHGISGIHAESVLVVVDEADGVAPPIWTALDSYMTEDGARMLGIGNPRRAASTFRQKMSAGIRGVHRIRIDGLRLPTMSRAAVSEWPELLRIFEREGLPFATDEDAARAKKKGIATPTKYGEWLQEWGEDHPYWYSSVRGLYPPASEYQMFTQEMLDAAYALDVTPLPRGGVSFGFDIAEQGGDRTVGLRAEGGSCDDTGRLGLKVRQVYAKRGGKQPLITAFEAIKSIAQPFHRVAVDANGVGWGVFEMLVAARFNAVAHKGSNKARRPDVYVNRKSEIYYHLQQRMMDVEIDLDPNAEDADELAAHLLSVQWVPTDQKAPRKVETRADRVRRGDESPDFADALTITVGYAEAGSVKPVGDVSVFASGGSFGGASMDTQF